ncbi:MAG: RNA polymerase sporulation sigma factor SigG [Clostridia bacterium]|nr:RNA polymerase sporulation sigma factor SigG [Clostridia bacterium]
MQGKVEICGVNTSKLAVLKNDETMKLLIKAKSGDKKARDELVAGNLKLVLAVLQKFTGRGESSDDLFQIGCIGLIKAIDNFDPIHGVRFSTYAVPMIIGELRRYLRDNSSVRVSRSMRDNAYKALTAKEEFIAKNQREPTPDEIAKMLGLKREDVVFALDAIADPVSLYDPIYQDGGDTICVMDQIRDNTSTDDNWIEQISIKQAVTDLDDREKRILALRFYDGKTQTEVAKEIGISQAQVSRLEKGVLDKVKRRLS